MNELSGIWGSGAETARSLPKAWLSASALACLDFCRAAYSMASARSVTSICRSRWITRAEMGISADRHASSVAEAAASWARNFAACLSFARLPSAASAWLHACFVDVCFAMFFFRKAGLASNYCLVHRK